MSWENTGAGHWHYTTFWLRDDDSGMTALRDMFPDAEADEMNFVLFSTSGVHGSYCTIEEVESDPDRSTVTFLVVHPRLVTLRYGNCVPQTEDDFSFLKKLRANSHKAVLKIGL